MLTLESLQSALLEALEAQTEAQRRADDLEDSGRFDGPYHLQPLVDELADAEADAQAAGLRVREIGYQIEDWLCGQRHALRGCEPDSDRTDWRAGSDAARAYLDGYKSTRIAMAASD